MDIFTNRNWKFNIAFDNNAYKEIMHHSFLYEPKERDILNYQIDFYRKNFTFEQLIRSFRVLKTSDEIATFKDAVVKRKNGIMFMPKELKQYYLDIINTEFPNHKEFLMEMLLLACNKKCGKNPMLGVYKKLLGCYYNPVKAKLANYAKRRAVKPKTSPYNGDYRAMTKHIIKDLSLDLLSQGIWGKYDVDNLRIDCTSEVGTGKFITKHLFNSDTDSFLIQTAGNTLSLDELKLSIYGNVYPGRGHIINTLLYKRSYNFDGGAEFILHGWSVFSAWHIYNTAYTKYSKVLYSKINNFLLHGNWQDSLTKMYYFLLGHFSKQEATRLMIMITQYPGKFESYVMGALATEQLIHKKFATSPMGLLDEYKKRNLADFFALFKPNTNPC